jgi:hypothetical protein
VKRFVSTASAIAALLLPSALYAYSEHELHAIYLQMEYSKIIQCGMAEDYFVEKYHACKSGKCDASWVVEQKDGKCTDVLTFEHIEGDDELKIVLNGKSFRAKPVPIPKANGGQKL